MSRHLLIAFSSSEALSGIGFAQHLGLPYDVLVLVGESLAECGAETVLTTNLTELPPADGLARALQAHVGSYSHLSAVSSMASKDLMANLAGRLDAAMVTDAIAVESPTVFRRPICAGTVIATVEVLTSPTVITFRPAAFPIQTASSASSGAQAIELNVQSRAERVRSNQGSGSRPELTQAKVIVSGGRPLRDAETFERVLGGLADQLGGAVGATRAAVDSGIAPNDLQIGQTGKIVAPDLYIAAGVSGSTQHLAGIKDSKIIVAINKDPDAPIFESADFGLVADLFDAIPELQAKLRP